MGLRCFGRPFVKRLSCRAISSAVESGADDIHLFQRLFMASFTREILHSTSGIFFFLWPPIPVRCHNTWINGRLGICWSQEVSILLLVLYSQYVRSKTSTLLLFLTLMFQLETWAPVSVMSAFWSSFLFVLLWCGQNV
jgi:hypothetical protein